MPDHRASVVGGGEGGERGDVRGDEFGVVLSAASGAGWGLGFVATEMDEGRVVEGIEEFGDSFAEDLLGIGVGETPVPTAGFIERRVFGMKIEDCVF